jgi:hypothetical protein
MGLRYWEAAHAWREHGATRKVLDLNARLCLGQYDAAEWRAKWWRLSWDQVFRVLIPVAKRDGMQAACR